MKNKNNLGLWIIPVIVVIVILLLVFIPRQKQETVKIGFIGPLSGPVAYTGEPVRDAFEIANDQNNFFDDKNIEVIYDDGKCQTEEAVKIAQKFIEVDDINIIVSGVCSGSTLGIAPVAQEKKVILISPVAASPDITNAGEYVFRIASSSDLMAAKAANIVKELGYIEVGILYEANDYPVGWKESFKEEFIGLGGEVISEESFNTGDTDIKTQLIKIDNQNPEIILVTVLSAPSAIQVLKQAKELGIETPIVGNEVFSFKSVINSDSTAAEDIMVTTYDYDLESEEMKKLLSDYKQRYDKDMTEEIYGALGYDLYNLLYEAITFCEGDNPECIKDYFEQSGEIMGASGAFSIDENGDAIRDVVLRRVESGRLITLE